MTTYRGLTWDHPRGRRWLQETAPEWRARGVDIVWEAQALEGFEAHPIEELCDAYDLIVLDHPHLGDALAARAVRPIDEVLGSESPALAAAYAGPSLDSYRVDGRVWALPLDAATQVSARDARILAEPPVLWSEVEAVAGEVPVALSLAGPHALLTLFSVAAAFGHPPVDRPGSAWLPDDAVAVSLELLVWISARTRPEYAALNPIALLERVGSDDPLAYVPLVYGYSSYSSGSRRVPVTFGEAPRVSPGGLPGSVIGGTGLAVSRRAVATPELSAYLEWSVEASTQCRIVPRLTGQPARLEAWEDARVDREAQGFYRSTSETMRNAVVRPRQRGFPSAQQHGSRIVRDVLGGELGLSDGVRALRELAQSLHPVERGS